MLVKVYKAGQADFFGRRAHFRHFPPRQEAPGSIAEHVRGVIFLGPTKCGPCQHFAVPDRIAPNRVITPVSAAFASAIAELAERRRRALDDRRRCGIVEALQAMDQFADPYLLHRKSGSTH